jgi:hypothetical protein
VDQIYTNNNTIANESTKQEEVIEVRPTDKDDEFDNMLRNLKKKPVNAVVVEQNNRSLNPRPGGFLQGKKENAVKNKPEVVFDKDLTEDTEFDAMLDMIKKNPKNLNIKSEFRTGKEIGQEVEVDFIENNLSFANNLKNNFPTTEVDDEEFDTFIKNNRKDNNFTSGFSKSNNLNEPEQMVECKAPFIPEFSFGKGGKKITISSETLKRMEQMFENIDEKEEDDKIESLLPSPQKDTKIPRPNTHTNKFPSNIDTVKITKDINSCAKLGINSSDILKRKNNQLENPSKIPPPKKAFKFQENSGTIKAIRSIKKTVSINSLETIELYCVCGGSSSCPCKGENIIDSNNIMEIFLRFYNIPAKDTKLVPPSFYTYQYKYVAWKYYILSKFYSDPNIYNSNSILTHIKKKYDILYEQGKRSFLTKVIEKDSSINKNMILLVLAILKKDDTYEIELSDGYCSIYSVIAANSPIKTLIEKKNLIQGMKINIGLCKVEKEYNSTLYVTLFYNAISKADSGAKLGICKNIYLLKNLANIRSDGGEISMIDVIILKKYDYFVYDFKSKTRYSNNKLERLLEEKNNATEVNNNISFENCCYNFKIVCVDTLLYLNYLQETGVNINPINFDLLNFNKGCLKKSLKKKLTKQCFIEFSIKNINIYEAMLEGNRYQIAVFNTGNNTQDNKYLRLRANDTTRIVEKKLSLRKEPNIIRELCSMIDLAKEDRDISQLLKSNNYNYDGLVNQEFLLFGVYVKYIKVGDSLYIVLWTKEKCFCIIKVHDEKFFDLELISKKCLFSLKYCIFQIVYYYDNRLTAMRNQIYEKNFETRNIVIYMETNNYTIIKKKSDNSVMKEFNGYEENEDLVNLIIKCIS